MHTHPMVLQYISNTHIIIVSHKLNLYNPDNGILPLPMLGVGRGGGLDILTSSTCPRSWFIRDVSPGSLAPYDLRMPTV